MKRKALAVNLKLTLFIILGVLLAVFSFFVPELGRQLGNRYPNLAYLITPCLIFAWLTALPLVIAILKAWLIVTEIGKDNTYCVANAKRLQDISRLILADALLYCVALVMIIIGDLFHPAVYLFITVLIFGGAVASLVASTASHYILRYREKNNMQ